MFRAWSARSCVNGRLHLRSTGRRASMLAYAHVDSQRTARSGSAIDSATGSGRASLGLAQAISSARDPAAAAERAAADRGGDRGAPLPPRRRRRVPRRRCSAGSIAFRRARSSSGIRTATRTVVRSATSPTSHSAPALASSSVTRTERVGPATCELRTSHARRPSTDATNSRCVRAVDDADEARARPGDVLSRAHRRAPARSGKPAVWQGEIADLLHPEHAHPRPLDDVDLLLSTCAASSIRAARHAARSRTAAHGQRGIHHLGSSASSAPAMIPLPPLEEQRRIVQEVEERLSRIDAMRASIERAQRRSQTLRAAILERACGSSDPASPRSEGGTDAACCSVEEDPARVRSRAVSRGRGRFESSRASRSGGTMIISIRSVDRRGGLREPGQRSHGSLRGRRRSGTGSRSRRTRRSR